MTRLVQNGRVAVVLSTDRQAPWASVQPQPEKFLFDPDLVRYILGQGPWPKEFDGYLLDDLEVVWVDEGDRFYIGMDEYGYEYITYEKDTNWVTA